MHRSPGVFFDHDKGKSHSSGKLLFAARIIPYRGSWLDIEFDAKDIVYARIDRRRKIPVTSLLYALGMDGEEILSDLLQHGQLYARQGRLAPALRSGADEGHEGQRRPDRRRYRRGRARGRQEAHRARRPAARRKGPEGSSARRTRICTANISPTDLYDPQTGEIFAEAGDEITAKTLPALIEAGFAELPLLDIDHVNIGPYIRNTLAVDKNSSREDALFDIYRVMRPGEPPTLERRRRCSIRCSSIPSATIFRRSAASR